MFLSKYEDFPSLFVFAIGTAMRMFVHSATTIYSPHGRSCSVLPSDALIVRLVDFLKLAVISMPVNRIIPLTCVSVFGAM